MFLFHFFFDKYAVLPFLLRQDLCVSGTHCVDWAGLEIHLLLPLKYWA